VHQVAGLADVAAGERDEDLLGVLLVLDELAQLIVVGGALEPEGLRQAETQQLRGIIAGSMPATLRELALAAPFPIMLTEGFGSLTMAAPAFELFKASTTREASLRAVSQTRWGAQRPEVVIPVSAREAIAGEAPPAHAALQHAALVRICAGEHMGQTGRVLSDHPQVRVLASGARARSVEIELQEHVTVWVAITNLEAIA